MRIVELRADNFKRLRAVRVRPDGALVAITGRNAQGKSSVLDAVWAALGGKAAAPERPIRVGAERAEVTVDLGDLRVTRRWAANDRSSLSVETRDGLRPRSPQAVLDALVGELTFDPLAFARLPAREQAATLRRVAGLDTAGLDAERAKLYDARTAASREANRLEALFASLPDGAALANAEDVEEVRIADLLAAHAEATQVEREQERRRRLATEARRRVSEAEQAVAGVRRRLAECEQALAVAERDAAAREADAAGGAPTDLARIAKALAEAETTNARARTARDAKALAAKLAAERAKVAELSQAIGIVDARKREALAAAKLPVVGLAVDGDAVVLNGLPLAQASAAERLRVSLALGAALNPRLRVLLVRDGSLLDREGLTAVTAWAEERGMQVWLERVAGEGDPVGVVIEDGEVVGAVEEPEVAVHDGPFA